MLFVLDHEGSAIQMAWKMLIMRKLQYQEEARESEAELESEEKEV
jgi:hypothetical protein